MPSGFYREWIYGYAILPCFKTKTLAGSEESEMICNRFLCKIFDLFFAPFWSGRIRVTAKVTEKF